MRWVVTLAIGAFFLFGACGILRAADEPAKTEKPNPDATKGHKGGKDSKSAAKKFAVIKSGEELKVVQEDKVADLQSQADKAYKDAKKKSPKADVKKVTITVVKGGFATEKDAEKYLKDLKDKEKKGGDAKGADKGETKAATKKIAK